MSTVPREQGDTNTLMVREPDDIVNVQATMAPARWQYGSGTDSLSPAIR